MQSQAKAKQSKAKPTQSKARKASIAMLSVAYSKSKQKLSNAKQNNAKLSKAKQSNAKQSKDLETHGGGTLQRVSTAIRRVGGRQEGAGLRLRQASRPLRIKVQKRVPNAEHHRTERRWRAGESSNALKRGRAAMRAHETEGLKEKKQGVAPSAPPMRLPDTVAAAARRPPPPPPPPAPGSAIPKTCKTEYLCGLATLSKNLGC